MKDLLHTPEGVRDYYNGECAGRRKVVGEICREFMLYGYQQIQTPAFEYFDIFNAERGSVASRYMYKLFDRDGETLVLRPDFTPSIARCAAKYYQGINVPIRLYYEGNIYVNQAGYQGKLKESMHAGVEYVGDDSTAANAEVIALAADVLRSVGLTSFQIEVGDVRYFNGIMDEAGLDDEARVAIRACIEDKNHFGLEELLERHHISDQVAVVLDRLPQMFGNPEDILEEARSLTNNPNALHAVERLEALYRQLHEYGADSYVTFDLGMLGKQDYYTGIIFRGYTYGSGVEIISGGRYNDLMGQFGRSAPAVGFGINVDELMQALYSQEIPVEGRPEAVLILCGEDRFGEAVREARALRGQRIPVHLMAEERDLRDLQFYIRENRITKIIHLPHGSSEREVTEKKKGGI